MRSVSNVLRKSNHGELQIIGAIGSLLAGVRGFNHLRPDVRDVRCLGPGVELRVGYFTDSPLRSQMMPDIESARVLAQRWLDTARPAAKGG
jgi:hypothetical protein